MPDQTWNRGATHTDVDAGGQRNRERCGFVELHHHRRRIFTEYRGGHSPQHHSAEQCDEDFRRAAAEDWEHILRFGSSRSMPRMKPQDLAVFPRIGGDIQITRELASPTFRSLSICTKTKMSASAHHSPRRSRILV